MGGLDFQASPCSSGPNPLRTAPPVQSVFLGIRPCLLWLSYSIRQYITNPAKHVQPAQQESIENDRLTRQCPTYLPASSSPKPPRGSRKSRSPDPTSSSSLTDIVQQQRPFRQDIHTRGPQLRKGNFPSQNKPKSSGLSRKSNTKRVDAILEPLNQVGVEIHR